MDCPIIYYLSNLQNYRIIEIFVTVIAIWGQIIAFSYLAYIVFVPPSYKIEYQYI